MSLSAAQIVTIACANAHGPRFVSQGGQRLNQILADLCQTYDLAVARGTSVFNFNPSLASTAAYPNLTPGSGPYNLAADFLRMWDEKDAMWFLQGVPYPMIPCDLSEYDGLVQQAGLSAYPYIFATDMAQSPPALVVYPPPSGAYQVMIRYCRQMPDIATPESSATVPWFPSQGYLIKKLTAAMCELTDDDRQASFEAQADDILGRYLKLKDDDTDRAKTVKLDRRRFGSAFSRLPNTKLVGW